MVDTLLTILAIHAALLGFALSFAGVLVIIAPTREDQQALKEGYELARQKSWWHAQLFAFRNIPPSQFQAFTLLIERWPQKPLGRKLVYWGVGCLIIAATIRFTSGW
jgi:hypothetical protein